MRINKSGVLITSLALVAFSNVALAYHSGLNGDDDYSDSSFVEQVYDSYPYISIKGGVSASFNESWSLSNDKFVELITPDTDVNSPTAEKSTTFAPSIAIGYKFPDSPVSIELAYYHFQRNLEWDKLLSKDAIVIDNYKGSSDLASHVVLLNGYWNFYTNTNFIPYVGLGIGLAYNRMQNDFTKNPAVAGDVVDNATGNSKGLAMAATFGARYAITKHFAIDAAVSYFRLTAAEMDLAVLKDEFDTTKFAESDNLNVLSGMVGIDLRF